VAVAAVLAQRRAPLPELGDRIVGIMGGYIRWSGLVSDATKTIEVTERLTGRQLDPFARDVIMHAAELRPA